jgi:hypothetical protein
MTAARDFVAALSGYALVWELLCQGFSSWLS